MNAGWHDAAFAPFLGDEIIHIGRIDRSWLNRNRSPVGTQFIGDNLGNDGEAALAHFDLRADDRDMAVRPDLDEAAQYIFARGRSQTRTRLARPKPPPHIKPAAHKRPGEKPSAAERSGILDCIKQTHCRA